MYCEYFKLYKIIIEYINEKINDKKILDIIKLNNFPAYKDLEPFKEYNYEYIINIHENILILLSLIIENINIKEDELSVYKNKKDIGLNIDNFVTTFNYDIITIKEKTNLFISYIEFFHKLHHKYFKRFSNKIKLIFINIDNDIKFDKSFDLNDTNKLNDIEITELNNIEDKIAELNNTEDKITELNNTEDKISELNDIILDDNNIYKDDDF